MGPYDEETGRNLDHSDVEHDVLNGYLVEDSTHPGTYYNGDGECFDEEYNPIE